MRRPPCPCRRRGSDRSRSQRVRAARRRDPRVVAPPRWAAAARMGRVPLSGRRRHWDAAPPRRAADAQKFGTTAKHRRLAASPAPARPAARDIDSGLVVSRLPAMVSRPHRRLNARHSSLGDHSPRSGLSRCVISVSTRLACRGGANRQGLMRDGLRFATTTLGARLSRADDSLRSRRTALGQAAAGDSGARADRACPRRTRNRPRRVQPARGTGGFRGTRPRPCLQRRAGMIVRAYGAPRSTGSWPRAPARS